MPLPDDDVDPWVQRSTDGPGDGRAGLDCPLCPRVAS
jgi:hypothetical protein